MRFRHLHPRSSARRSLSAAPLPFPATCSSLRRDTSRATIRPSPRARTPARCRSRSAETWRSRRAAASPPTTTTTAEAGATSPSRSPGISRSTPELRGTHRQPQDLGRGRYGSRREHHDRRRRSRRDRRRRPVRLADGRHPRGEGRDDHDERDRTGGDDQDLRGAQHRDRRKRPRGGDVRRRPRRADHDQGVLRSSDRRRRRRQQQGGRSGRRPRAPGSLHGGDPGSRPVHGPGALHPQRQPLQRQPSRQARQLVGMRRDLVRDHHPDRQHGQQSRTGQRRCRHVGRHGGHGLDRRPGQPRHRDPGEPDDALHERRRQQPRDAGLVAPREHGPPERARRHDRRPVEIGQDHGVRPRDPGQRLDRQQRRPRRKREGGGRRARQPGRRPELRERLDPGDG